MTATPETIAAAIDEELDRPLNYRPVDTGGAARTADRLGGAALTVPAPPTVSLIVPVDREPYPAVMGEGSLWAGKTLRQWVPVAVDDVVRAVAPRRVVLFGSVARGDEGPDSDLDLLVVLDRMERADRLRLVSYIRRAITARAPIDVFVTDLDEYERRKDVLGSMVYWPAREGEVVYDRVC